MTNPDLTIVSVRSHSDPAASYDVTMSGSYPVRCSCPAFTDSDTKGVRYRYFLDVAGVAPQDKDTYQGVPVLYVIAREPWGVLRERDVWETSAFTHGSAAVLGTIQDVTVYRVQKE
jgi:hypothetical protein